MITVDDIVAAARTYLVKPTPFLHQGRHRDTGVDRAGLIVCVAYDIGLQDVRIINYSRQPEEETFKRTLQQYLDVVQYADLQVADIITFRLAREQHLALVTKIGPPLSIIHAYSKVGRVVEHILNDDWMKRLRGCYRYRGIA
jgi:uncharacterized protein YijF (DUF1287 family)